MNRPTAFAFLALISSVAVVFANDNAGERPVIMDVMRRNGFRLFDVGCALRDIFADRETSDHIYNVIDGFKQVAKESKQCANDRLIPALNDKSQALGKLINSLRIGKEGDVQSVSEIFQDFNLASVFWVAMMNRNLFDGKLRNQVQGLADQIMNDCLREKFQKYKPDLDFVIEKFKSLKSI